MPDFTNTIYGFVWFTIVGACVGSFLNVVAYRLPEGKSLMFPGSACPKCGNHLKWYDNVPILAWLWLGAKCRYCKAPISFQYPLVEAICMVLWGAGWWIYFRTDLVPFAGQFTDTWPVFVVHMALVSVLLVSTVIDAKLYIIPLELPWFISLVAVIALPLAVWQMPAIENMPMVPKASTALANIALGGVIGLAVAYALVLVGVLPRSFADEQEWFEAEKKRRAEEKAQAATAEADAPSDEPVTDALPPSPADDESPGMPAGSDASAAAPTDAAETPVEASATESADTPVETAPEPEPETAISAPAAQSDASPEGDAATAPDIVPDSDADEIHFLDYPHSRREVLKELVYLILPILGAIAGYYLMPRLVEGGSAAEYPMAVQVLGGCAFGYLFGGAMIWFTRIFGTLGLGREAMGLGDVHLLAAVGTVIGYKPVIIIFFVAPFIGIVYAIAALGMSQVMRKRMMPIPYGPHLAAASVAVMYAWRPIVMLFDNLITP